MLAFYRKKEVLFAVAWILAYVIGSSLTDQVSDDFGLQKCVTLPFQLVLTGLLVGFIAKNGLSQKYGLCKPAQPARRMLWYLPLAVLASVNLWLGVTLQMDALNGLLYFASMVFAGILEELIFRGLLFRAMARTNVVAAVVVTSLTFGVGHIVNLINGSGTEFLSNLCQVMYATAIGFAFVETFYRGGSIVPCIACHSVLNALSTFANDAAWTPQVEVIVSLALTAVAAGYAVYLIKKVPVPQAA